MEFKIEQFGNWYDSYTPLSVLHVQILLEIEGGKYLRHPPPMKAPLKSHDKKKYCQFHHDHGYDIEHCIQLRDEIETLI